ncbi:hypothetical protein HDV00_011253 [Rhizophlyctis rosea]|nr:hypothetical protein HDV00_011253 [Rhizophlyctis rosea]
MEGISPTFWLKDGYLRKEDEEYDRSVIAFYLVTYEVPDLSKVVAERIGCENILWQTEVTKHPLRIAYRVRGVPQAVRFSVRELPGIKVRRWPSSLDEVTLFNHVAKPTDAPTIAPPSASDTSPPAVETEPAESATGPASIATLIPSPVRRIRRQEFSASGSGSENAATSGPNANAVGQGQGTGIAGPPPTFPPSSAAETSTATETETESSTETSTDLTTGLTARYSRIRCEGTASGSGTGNAAASGNNANAHVYGQGSAVVGKPARTTTPAAAPSSTLTTKAATLSTETTEAASTSTETTEAATSTEATESATSAETTEAASSAKAGPSLFPITALKPVVTPAPATTTNSFGAFNTVAPHAFRLQIMRRPIFAGLGKRKREEEVAEIELAKELVEDGITLTTKKSKPATTPSNMPQIIQTQLTPSNSTPHPVQAPKRPRSRASEKCAAVSGKKGRKEKERESEVEDESLDVPGVEEVDAIDADAPAPVTDGIPSPSYEHSPLPPARDVLISVPLDDIPIALYLPSPTETITQPLLATVDDAVESEEPVRNIADVPTRAASPVIHPEVEKAFMKRSIDEYLAIVANGDLELMLAAQGSLATFPVKLVVEGFGRFLQSLKNVEKRKEREAANAVEWEVCRRERDVKKLTKQIEELEKRIMDQGPSWAEYQSVCSELRQAKATIVAVTQECAMAEASQRTAEFDYHNLRVLYRDGASERERLNEKIVDAERQFWCYKQRIEMLRKALGEAEKKLQEQCAKEPREVVQYVHLEPKKPSSADYSRTVYGGTTTTTTTSSSTSTVPSASASASQSTCPHTRNAFFPTGSRTSTHNPSTQNSFAQHHGCGTCADFLATLAPTATTTAPIPALFIVEKRGPAPSGPYYDFSKIDVKSVSFLGRVASPVVDKKGKGKEIDSCEGLSIYGGSVDAMEASTQQEEDITRLSASSTTGLADSPIAPTVDLELKCAEKAQQPIAEEQPSKDAKGSTMVLVHTPEPVVNVPHEPSTNVEDPQQQCNFPILVPSNIPAMSSHIENSPNQGQSQLPCSNDMQDQSASENPDLSESSSRVHDQDGPGSASPSDVFGGSENWDGQIAVWEQQPSCAIITAPTLTIARRNRRIYRHPSFSFPSPTTTSFIREMSPDESIEGLQTISNLPSAIRHNHLPHAIHHNYLPLVRRYNPLPCPQTQVSIGQSMIVRRLTSIPQPLGSAVEEVPDIFERVVDIVGTEEVESKREERRERVVREERRGASPLFVGFTLGVMLLVLKAHIRGVGAEGAE